METVSWHVTVTLDIAKKRYGPTLLNMLYNNPLLTTYASLLGNYYCSTCSTYVYIVSVVFCIAETDGKLIERYKTQHKKNETNCNENWCMPSPYCNDGFIGIGK